MKRQTIARALLLAVGLSTIAGAALAQGAPSAENARQIRERAKPLAEQGNANAQYNLGVIYDEGYGVDQDYAKAVDWYEKAAQQGYAKAEHNLGILYQEGRGVDKDPAQAAHWFKRAAEHGEPASQNNLAVMYVRGQGVSQDVGKAAEWAARAAKAGNESATNNLPYIIKNLPHSRIDGDNVNIRSLPSTRGRVLRQADRNTRVVIVGHDDDWSHVLFADDYELGWVANFLLADSAAPMRDEQPKAQTADADTAGAAANESASSGSPSATTTTTQVDQANQADQADQADQAEAPAQQKHIGGDVVNVRERPTTNSGVAFQAKRDQTVTVVDKQGDWRHVRFEDGRTGWVAGFLLAK